MTRSIDANKACRIIEQLFCGDCRSYTHCENCPYNNVLMLLRNLPTVEAEPVRHGRWILQTNGHGTCSTCGTSVDLLNGMTWEYCPKCGAKMDEEENV